MDAATKQGPGPGHGHGLAMRRATLAVVLAALAVLTTGMPADARRAPAVPSLTRISELSATQIATLRGSGIRSIAALASASPDLLTRTLRIDLTAATRLVEGAKRESARLTLVYSGARAKFPFSRMAGRGAAPTAEELYAQLIAPTNACTLLVRKVCGLQNQCSSAPGCPVAKQLLDVYNTDSDKTPLAESCVISLEDSIVFPQCTTP